MNAAENLFTNRVSDSVKIVAPPGAVLALVNMVSLNELLQSVVLLLTIASLSYRWRRPIMGMLLRRRRLALLKKEKETNDEDPKL